MKRTLQELKGDFFVLDLGSAHIAGILKQVPGLEETITVIEVDALLDKPVTTPTKIALNRAVAGKPGRRIFKERKYAPCSSFLEPKPELVKAYGLDDYFIESKAIPLEC